MIPSSSPWRLADVMSLVTALLIGGAAILVGWIGVSAEPAPSRQTAWMNIGIGGLVVAGVGTALWLMTARRAVGQRRRRLLADVTASAGPEFDAGPATPSERLVTLPGMSRYHRSSCELVVGKAVKPFPRRGGRSKSLSPCGVCQPDSTAIAP